MEQGVPAVVACAGGVVDEPQAVLAAALEAYVAIDPGGRVVAWNPAAERTFGFSHAQACGQPVCELIIPGRYRQAHRAGLARLAAGGPGRVLGQRLQLFALHADGHEFPIEMTLAVTDTAAGRVFHSFAHDITAAYRASRFTDVEAAVSRGLVEAASTTAATERVDPGPGRRHRLAAQPRRRPHRPARRRRGTAVHGRADPRRVVRLRRPHRRHRRHPHRAAVRRRRAGGQYWERRRAEELAVELACTKDEFLALVTHELRNPLSIILSTAALLGEDLDSLDPAEQREYLRTITRNAGRLSVMADDLLDLSRLESGTLAIRPTATDLCAVIDAAVHAVDAQATTKNLTITTTIPDALPLHADPDRLRQVADNLLSNAVKYTPAGGTITVTAHGDANGDWITWTVADTGIGIPPAERPRLFRRFYRASTAVDGSIPGNGLGLVITRTIIERHHGTIDVTDHTGPGTTFTIALPTKGLQE